MIPPTRGVAKLGYDGSDLVGVGTEETFDECEFKKPNAKCPSNDPGTTLREPAFLARPEDFPYPISPFPAAWSLGKNQIRFPTRISSEARDSSRNINANTFCAT